MVRFLFWLVRLIRRVLSAFGAAARLVRTVTPSDITAWARAVQGWALRLVGVLTTVVATAIAVRSAVLDWVLGAGWPTVEQVISATGPYVAAGLVTGAVLVASVVAVAAAGLVERACEAVR